MQPTSTEESTKLKYDFMLGYKRLATLSEPFLTNLIDSILNCISGSGVPDYPDKIKAAIFERVKKGLN